MLSLSEMLIMKMTNHSQKDQNQSMRIVRSRYG